MTSFNSESKKYFTRRDVAPIAPWTDTIVAVLIFFVLSVGAAILQYLPITSDKAFTLSRGSSQQTTTYTYLDLNVNHYSVIQQDSFATRDASIFESSFWTFDKATGEPVKLGRALRNQNILNEFVPVEDQPVVLEQSFVIDHENQQLLIALYGQPVQIPFDNLGKYLAFDLAESLFGLNPFGHKDPDNIDCTVEKCLALTFDDGPGYYTEWLLDILKSTNAKASFFILGNRAYGYANTIARMANEGHDVGSHSWNHRNLVTLSYPQIQDDLGGATSAIQSVSGEFVKFFRPPYGNHNESVRQITGGFGQSIVLWDVDTRDWQFKDAGRICSVIVNGARPNAVILLHDIYATSVEGAECAIRQLSHEYTFVNLSTLYKR